MHAAVALARDQPGGFEHAQVPADGRRRHAERLAQFTDAGGTAGELFEHAPPRRMSQRTEDGVEWIALSINHVVNYKHAGPGGARRKTQAARCAPEPLGRGSRGGAGPRLGAWRRLIHAHSRAGPGWVDIR